MVATDQKTVPVKYTQIFINNEWVNSVSGKTFPTINPATGEKIADIQEGDKSDIDKAVAAARKAFELGSQWRTSDATQRAAYLMKLADLIERDQDIIARLECLDVGKPYSQAVMDPLMAVKCYRFNAGYADKIAGKTLPVDGPYFAYTRLEPVGVVGAIIPWNFPFNLLSWKIAPALAAGCTIVIKPAEQTPLSALYLCSLVLEAEIPPGVINIVPGYGPTAGAALTQHMDVDKITFTGSTEIGRLIMQASSQSNLKKVSLELGGKSPCIVFADADLDYAVEMAHFGLFFNTGQCCTAASRCYVQEDVYDVFVKKAVARAQKRLTGDPWDASFENGPLINQEQLTKVLSMIESGKKEGAKLLCGGKRHGETGYFVESTVFADVTDEMTIAKEEIFGPVQQIIKFKTLEEVLPRANKTSYGLAAAVFTKDIDKALTIANSVRAGTVWVNCYHVISNSTPFGGYKESGIGREHGEEGIMGYCEYKTVFIKVPVKNS